MTDLNATYRPDWVSPPGDTILDIIEERDWTQSELAQRLGYTTKHVNQLIKGKVPLTEEAAIRLERVVGSTVGFWLSREAKYREHCARLHAVDRFSGWVDWLERMPVKALMNANVIKKQRIDAKSKPELVESCLCFFGVASPDEWQARYGQMQGSFRRSREEQSDIGAISAWLRMGEREAEKQDCPKYDRNKFEDVLINVRSLTTQPPEVFQEQLHDLFKAAGVAFTVVPAIPKAHVSGVARWLNPHRPLIQLSLYGKTNDKFWFTLFHEAAHILLHANEKKSVFLDDPSRSWNGSQQEIEANDWASEFLIPSKYDKTVTELKTKLAVQSFADSIGIHPGIVVGRLQHEGLIEPSWMNDMKVTFCFVEGV